MVAYIGYNIFVVEPFSSQGVNGLTDEYKQEVLCFYSDFADAAAISTVFVSETKPIILHYVRCRGHEANLNDCPTRDNVFCGPSRPRAGVRCLQGVVCVCLCDFNQILTI